MAPPKVTKSKKIAAAAEMAEQQDLTSQMWLADGVTSLRRLLDTKGPFRDAFGNFLKMEQGDAELAFYVAALDAKDDEERLTELYETYVASVGDGIGQQQRTKATQKLYTTAKKKRPKQLNEKKVREAVQREAEATLKGLALNAFPRFVKSDLCKKALAAIKGSGGSAGGGAKLAAALEKAGSMAPQDADQWLASFMQMAETWPACIVVSDMTIPGAPMVYVNPEFCRVTEYERDEAVGRNCRFLQGPETEPESIAVIQQTLAKGEDCHVLLTNYKKSGDTFKNLLSMRPVFDGDGLYRYTIGVQFEIDESDDPSRLAQLNKLLQLLPRKLPLRSAAKARQRGMRAARVDGEATPAAATEDTTATEADEEVEAEPEHDWSKCIFALTRIAWLREPEKAVDGLLLRQKTSKILEEYAAAACSPFAQTHLQFAIEATAVMQSTGSKRDNLLRTLHKRMEHNPMFYCTSTEIVIGHLDRTDWDPVAVEVAERRQASIRLLAADLLPRLLQSTSGPTLVECVRKLEQATNGTEDVGAHTVAFGVETTTSDKFWLHMFANATASYDDIGLVISDMRVPGIPLTWINEKGFMAVTGYGQEQVGKKCTFLQGPETPSYLIDEIVEALREAKPIVVKLFNYKRNGDPFQCYFAMHPIFGADGDYLYQVGAQINMDVNPTKVCRQMAALEQLLQLLPSTVLCSGDDDEKRIMPTSLTGDLASEVNPANPTAKPARSNKKAKAVASREPEPDADSGPVVETGHGANKTPYGKRLGKKHKDALHELTTNAWLVDVEGSLSMILEREEGRSAFGDFLDTEYNRASLDFYIKAKELEKAGKSADRDQQAQQLMNDFLGTSTSGKGGSKGIGQQDRTAATDKLWKSSGGKASRKTKNPFATLQKESRDTFKMLAVETFPRFLQSDFAKKLSKVTGGGGGGSSSNLDKALQKAGSCLPQDADEWLSAFIQIADTWPACIVVSDMTIPGAPMVYVNPEFSRVTEYEREEACGRNCRFLQGPDTEPESIGVIQRTLSKGEDCHVLLTNYKKTGTKFKNLLSMRPVFDADGIYRYVIGVQFEVIDDENLPPRLAQLDKLLKMLPRKLPFKSNDKAREKGAKAARTDFSANDALVKNGKTVKKKASDDDVEEEDEGHESSGSGTNTACAASMFAITRLSWLTTPEDTMAAIVEDKDSMSIFTKWVKASGSHVARGALDFLDQSTSILSKGKSKRKPIARKAIMKMYQNMICYCTTIEIVVGEIDEQDFTELIDNIELWSKKWINIMAHSCLLPFMNSVQGAELVYALRSREVAGKTKKLRLATCARGLKDSDDFYLDMVRVMSAKLKHIGLVVSDMRVPGIPLVHVNDPGFLYATGYGQEQIGKKCSFLQGDGTEGYLIDEIVDSLRHAEPLVIKITNYKKNGTLFQCVFTLSPIFDQHDEYRYQIGLQMDETAEAPMSDKHLISLKALADAGRVFMPAHTSGQFGKARVSRLLTESAYNLIVEPKPVKKTPPKKWPKYVAPQESSAESKRGKSKSLDAVAAEAKQPATSQNPSLRLQITNKKREVVKSKKNAQAMAVVEQQDLTSQMWLADGVTSLRRLLDTAGPFRKAFEYFLKMEQGDAELQFYVAFLEAKQLDEQKAEEHYMSLYGTYVASVGDGIGQQQRTKATQKLYQTAKKKKPKQLNTKKVRDAVQREAESTLKGLALNAFPRFVKTELCKKALKAMKGSGSSSGGAKLAAALEKAGSMAPQDADQWLANFMQMAETWPACIVVSDMTIPGAPMVYVNPEFCKVTEYERDEAVGRNCRFLQGPETEPESIAVIQQTLAKGEDCHVLLTNYKKNGDTFKNLLSMRPVFDGDGLYRYTIGVQFEIDESDDPSRLAQLNKLLQLLPRQLPLKSAPEARTRGLRAARVDGEANATLTDEEIKKATSDEDIPRDWTKTTFALTRIAWLREPEKAIDGLLQRQKTSKILEDFAAATCSPLTRTHLQFAIEATAVMNTPKTKLKSMLKRLIRRMEHNPMWYCTNFPTIEIGTLPEADFGPILADIVERREVSVRLLATDLLPRLLHSTTGPNLVDCVRKLETVTDGTEHVGAHTVAFGVEPSSSDKYWMNLFANALWSYDDIGIVMSDMRVPGIPLCFINENGFKAVTGYGQEQIGKKCSFLQGPDTPSYLVDEIVEALREAKPLVVKLINYKRNGDAFQCYLVLQPIFGPEGEYVFMLGAQINMDLEEAKVCRLLADLEELLRLLPTSILCSTKEDEHRVMPVSALGDASLEVDPANPTAKPAKSRKKAKPIASREPEPDADSGPVVETGHGANKTPYGKRLGKKHKDALHELTTNAWLVDVEGSLSMILEREEGRSAFGDFLDTEYNRASLDFYIKAKELEKAGKSADRDQQAQQLMNDFLGTSTSGKGGSKGIGQQDRTAATDKLWKSSGGKASRKTKNPFATLQKESRDTFKMLAVETFPRFLQSDFAKKLSKVTGGGGGGSSSNLDKALQKAGSCLPQDADEWLSAFIQIADTWPACIVVSDMTIPGAPMVYVNPEFSRVTEYEREEACGRNCRFLQGPDTEPESIGVIQRTLSKGEDCHVLLTNYKKTGTKFKNLLSMRPVFDADGIYRYVIGVQFEVIDDENLPPRLAQLDKLLKMLPRKLPFKSNDKAREKGAKAARTDFSANDALVKKGSKKGRREEEEEEDDEQGGSSGGGSGAYSRSIFAFTKTMWLSRAEETMAALVEDKESMAIFSKWVKASASPVAKQALTFFEITSGIVSKSKSKRKPLIRKAILPMYQNMICYYSTIEIIVGELDEQDFAGLSDLIETWHRNIIKVFAHGCLVPLLDSAYGAELVYALRDREVAGKSSKVPRLATCARGLNERSDDFYLDMVRIMSQQQKDVGIVVSDMRVPGIPLVHINDPGFRYATGYGQEQIGKKCSFLQGKDTEPYLNDEIVDSLRHGEPLVIRLINYKMDGNQFECMFTLSPIYDTNDEYRYQIGMQMNVSDYAIDSEAHFASLRALATLGRVFLQPKTTATATNVVPWHAIGVTAHKIIVEPPKPGKKVGVRRECSILPQSQKKASSSRPANVAPEVDASQIDLEDPPEPEVDADASPRQQQSSSNRKNKQVEEEDEEDETPRRKASPPKSKSHPTKNKPRVEDDDEEEDEEEEERAAATKPAPALAPAPPRRRPPKPSSDDEEEERAAATKPAPALAPAPPRRRPPKPSSDDEEERAAATKPAPALAPSSDDSSSSSSSSDEEDETPPKRRQPQQRPTSAPPRKRAPRRQASKDEESEAGSEEESAKLPRRPTSAPPSKPLLPVKPSEPARNNVSPKKKGVSFAPVPAKKEIFEEQQADVDSEEQEGSEEDEMGSRDLDGMSDDDFSPRRPAESRGSKGGAYPPREARLTSAAWQDGYDSDERPEEDEEDEDEDYDGAGKGMMTFADLKGMGTIGVDGTFVMKGAESNPGTAERAGPVHVWDIKPQPVEQQQQFQKAPQRPQTASPRVNQGAVDNLDSMPFEQQQRFSSGRKKRPKSASIGHHGEEMQTSPRVLEMMEEYGANELGQQLVSGKMAAKMQRVLEEMIDDELTAYRSIVQETGMQRNDSETIGTRSSMRSETMDLKSLKNERLLMQRLGFVEHVYALDERIAATQARKQQEIEIRQKENIERRMRMLQAQHERRMDQFREELGEQINQVRERQNEREEHLAEMHRKERDAFVERTIRTATCNDISATKCNCKHRYVCHHNKTASYKLRKQNPLVVRYRNAARKLRKNRRASEAMEFEEKADLIDKRESIAWTKRVQEFALRTQLPQLIERQEKASKSLKQKHATTVEQMSLSHKSAISNLERVLECERAKAFYKMKKQAVTQAGEEMGTHANTVGKEKEPDEKDIRGTMSANLAAAFIPDADPDDCDPVNINVLGDADLQTNWKPPTETGLQHSSALLDFS
ncbi:hypothetical protein CTAYLR_000727 [Chrysophaeum taylorii]|uniref:LOV domain-containing protein n=1 Tax=Chrysophaeum taylorii TaxID=2483200 RepID=A0AAD7UAX7_9STRA|nr:hypothetical protein CTAYLR_000727 [Chrysophaeum taylorii]